jgi:DNA-binding transcriptional ArsR family regulator
MKKLFALALLLAAVSTPLFAHAGHMHTYMGTVTILHGPQAFMMKTTDGNLSVHARKLEEAEYITCTKSFEGRMPKTQYRLTAVGRRALERYLDHMEALIRVTRER